MVLNMVVKDINENEFEEEVLKSETPVVIDFWAEWCGPCRMFSPLIEEVSEEYKGKVKFVKIDVDKNQQLASKYNVMSIPTAVLIDKGELKAVSVGAIPKESLKEWVNKNL